MPKAVFHTPPEHEEEEHVSQEVQPSSMQEHGNEDRGKKSCDCQVCEPIACDISRRDDSKDKNQSVNIWAVRKFKEEDPYIRDDDGESNKPEAPPPDVVGEGERNHRPTILHGEGRSAHGKSTGIVVSLQATLPS
jgi:hypothetical protein